MQENLFNIIKFDQQNLIPVITQDYKTGEVLMLAWMNKEALELTMSSGFVHYFSRSRAKLWKKGETSNQTQKLKELLIDCDGDSLIVKVEQNGVACHTGTKSCFFRTIINQEQVVINQAQLVSTKELYGK